MERRLKTHLIAAAALAVLAAPLAALADPPPWAGHGHGKAHDMPPGLAKKPYGLPPGQAKKIWGQGERLPMAYVTERRYIVYAPYRYDLPPAPYGYRWVRVDDRFYLAQTETGLISQVIAGLIR